MTLLISGRLPGPAGRLVPGWIEVDGATVAAARHGTPPRAPDVTVPVIAPGLSDLQVNGAAGLEALDGAAALDEIDRVLSRRGVLRWLAALPTAEPERIEAALTAAAERTGDPAHGLAGVHLEGPFLSPDRPGVHRRELLRAPAQGVPSYYDHPAVRVVTLAPELDGALELIGRLTARGVAVAIGHSGADAATTLRALDAGARLVTHLFNAMAPLHHRDPGVVGVALTDPRVRPCVIADGLHVDPIVLRLIRAAAGERVALVSDASAAAAAPPGRYTLAGVTIERTADGAVRAADGTLAGSGILLDEALRGWMLHAGAPLAEALAAATRGQALRPGGRADLVVVSEAGEVERVMRSGTWL
jgi:N-acetylglucosamine-6-phosphate deacetylase